MTTHRAHPHTQTVDGYRSILAAQDLVGLHLGLPFFLALPGIQLHIDPGDQARRQGHRPVFQGITGAADKVGDLPINVQNRRGRVVD